LCTCTESGGGRRGKGWWRREVNRERSGWREMKKKNEMRRKCGVREVKGVWSEEVKGEWRTK